MAVYATLDDVKRHLNKTSSTDDGELQDILDAATDIVRSLVGVPFDAAAVAEQVTAVGGTLMLSRYPLTGPVVVNGVAVEESFIDRAAGLVYGVRAVLPATVTYAVGGGPVPAAVALATSITAAHLWETQRANAPSPLALQEPDDIESLRARSSYSVPRRAQELLRPYMRTSQLA